MKNSLLERGVEAFGGMESQDLTSTLQNQIDQMSDDDLTAAIVETKRAIDALSATFHMFVADFDRREVADRVHVLTTKQWLKSTCAMSGTEASGVVKTSKALTAMPTVCEGALAGAVPATHVRILAQARDRHPEAFVGHEKVFADAATYLDARDLGRVVEHWRQQVDHDDAVADTIKRRARRHLSVDRSYDDMWAITGELDPESGHVVSAAVRSHADPGNLDPHDARTPGQRRADALTDICRYWLDHNTDTTVTCGGAKPHITVTVDYATLTNALGRLPEIDGTPVTPETIRRLTCDAGIIPVVLGTNSEPLDIGRRSRTIPPAIRRAVELRDKGCRWVGCDAPVSWCDVHHLKHWIDGGITALINLILLCRKHHVAVHEDGRAPPIAT